MKNSKWVFCPKPQNKARLRLFCFPYAGGGASVFSDWPRHFSSEIEICSIKLPGRETRFKEKPYRRIAELVRNLASEILPLLYDNDFALFGHSVGALISFELARHLRRNDLPCPQQLFMSAARAPDSTRPSLLDHKMEDRKFINKIIEIGGVPEELEQDQELLYLILPTLKADIEMLNTYRYIEEEPLDRRITAYCGLSDPMVSREEAVNWSRHTCLGFTLSMIPGGHFFIRENPEHTIRMIIQDLKIGKETSIMEARSS